MLLIEILDKIVDSDHMTIKERIFTGEYDGKYHNHKVTCDTKGHVSKKTKCI